MEEDDNDLGFPFVARGERPAASILFNKSL
jgi:hypothetical protein